MSNYHEIVDSTNIGSRGNYIQTHISNQGIIRIFYTDTSGNASAGTKNTIMCSIVDRSNTRQVIYNSAYKRNFINDKDINIAKYGENFKTYVYYSSPSNDSVFGEEGTDNSYINKFYIFPMHFQDDQGNPLYNKEGYSTILGKWWDGYFSGMALNIKNGWYAKLTGNVPDNYRFVNPIQTMTHALTEPNNWGEYPNMTQSKFTEDGTKIQENSQDNIIGNFSCAVAPTYQIYNNSEYNKQYVLWLGYDNTSFKTLGYNLSYYVGQNYVSNAVGNNGGFIFKGINTISNGNTELNCMPYSDIDLDISWNTVSSESINLELKSSDESSAQTDSNIYVQVSNDGNTWYAPGIPQVINIPHESSSETTSATLFSAGLARNTVVSVDYIVSSAVTQIRFIINSDDRVLLDYFKLDGTEMVEIQGFISNGFWPTTSPGLGWSVNSDDVQTSMNDTPIRTFSVSFPSRNTYNKGTMGRPYFIIRDQQKNHALLGYADLNYIEGSNSYENHFTNVIGPGNILNGAYDTKFHKIKCEKKSLENPGSWDTTGIHICFQKAGAPSSLIYYKFKGPISGTPLNTEEIYHDPIAAGSTADGKNPGGFCSMDVWGDNPRIAWYDSINSGSIWLAKSDDGGTTWDSSGVMIDSNVGTYQETGNKNYLSLTCDQKDGSVHISYFHNTEGVKYWTNSINAPQPIISAISNNEEDINAVDSARIFNYNNSIIVGEIDTGLPKRFDESNIDISWNQVNSSYNAIFSYRNPITDWDEIPNYVTMTDNIVYSKTKTKYYTGDFDKIFVAARVRTNTTIHNDIHNLFLIGGDMENGEGSYIGGLWYGAPYFGIQHVNSSIHLSSPIIKTVTEEDSSLNPSGDLDSSGAYYLNPNTDYDLEYYYDKIKKYAFIKVNQSGETEKVFQWNDISQNGGFNMLDGYLTIGNGSHVSEVNPWCGEKKNGIIKSIMIWNCDISHIPQYELYRNDTLIKSGIKTPYFKDSSGVILDKIPTLNTDYRYKVSSMGNSINVSQGISAHETKSQQTPVKQFNDMWYMDYIKNQSLINDISGHVYVTAMDRLDNSIWATMSQDTGSSDTGGSDNIYLVYSTDGGQSWQHNTSFSQTTVLNDVKNVMARCLKLYRDPSGAEWCFIGTEGYGIFISNTYLQDNPTGQELGTTWKQISDTSGNPLTGTYLKESSSLENNRTISYIHPVDLVKLNSASLYGDTDTTGDDISDNTFHLWIGTESPWTGVIGNIDYSGPGGNWWSKSWNTGSQTEQNTRDSNLYNFTCVAYSMVVKINGKLYESGLSKLRLRPWTTKQSGTQQYYQPLFQTPDKLGNSDNGFVKPENFVEWRAYRSPEVITALNSEPYPEGEYEGENQFSKKYKEIGFDVYLGGAVNNSSNNSVYDLSGVSPKVTARTDPDNPYTYSPWLSVSPWLDSSYNWYYTESFSDFDVDTTQQKYPTYTKIEDASGCVDMVIRGNYIDYSNNTLDYSKNIISGSSAIVSLSSSSIDSSLESFNVIDFGVEGDAVNIGCVGGKHGVYKTTDGGKTWTVISLISYDYNNKPGNSYLVGGSINGIFSKSRLNNGDTDFVYKSNNSSIRLQNNLSEFTYFESLGDNYINNNNSELNFKAYIPEKPNIGLSIVESNNSNQSSYWDYKNTSTYARIGGGNLLGDSKFKVDTSGNLSNYWVFDHKNSIVKGSYDLLFHKDISDNWQRIELIDPILDISSGVTCIQPIKDNSLLVWVSDISKNRTGFYKISQSPPMPSLILTYPEDNNEFRAGISIENYIVFYSYYTSGNDITYKWYTTIRNADGVSTTTETSDINSYIKTFDLIPESIYEFRVEAVNNYGTSWSETVSLETPSAIPEITSFYVTNSFVNSTLNWTYNLDQDNATSITQYDISRSALNYITGEDVSHNMLYDVSNNRGLTNIPPINLYRDNDIALNTVYKYYITPYSVDQSGAQVSQIITIGSGIPEFFKGIYYPVENKIIVSWLTDSVDVSSNPLANTTVSWDISKVRVDDISTMDTIEGVSGEKIYKKTYEITNDFLKPNYTYKFSVRAHYTNKWPSDPRTDPLDNPTPQLSLKSLWTEPLIFTIEAPVPQNLNVTHINDEIKLNWDTTTLYNLEVNYSLQYEYNSVVTNIDSIKTNNITLNGRNLPGGETVNFKIRAVYPNYLSSYSDIVSLDIPRYKPINIKINSYDDLNNETNKDVSYIKITWDACIGAIGYSLKRFDIYNGNISPTEPSVTVSNIAKNSYIDRNGPLGSKPSIPRRYVYKITANYK